eukprot:6205402-Pleurochrysis_carterae.AAC.2
MYIYIIRFIGGIAKCYSNYVRTVSGEIIPPRRRDGAFIAPPSNTAAVAPHCNAPAWQASHTQARHARTIGVHATIPVSTVVVRLYGT